MKIKTYRIIYIFALLIALLATIAGFSYTIYAIINNLTDSNDNFIICLCFVLLLIFNAFQIFTVVRSIKEGSIFFKSIIETDDKILNKGLIIGVNVALVLVISVMIYAILLALGFDLPLSSLPIANDIMAICFLISATINIIFFDLYILVYTQED